MTPQLSVVVPSVNGEWALGPTLDALRRQARVALEVLVVDRLGNGVRRWLRDRYPEVRVVEVSPGTTIPEMRHQAFRVATAPSIAVIEDHVIVPDDWAECLLRAQTPSTPVVAGAVDNAATERLVDWSAFLCEYSHCIPPLEGGTVQWLTGNNVVYPRDLLERFAEITGSGAWENRLHDAIRDSGIALTCHPEIVVGHKMHYTVGEYLSQRFLYARSYAGARVRGAGVVRRAFYGAAAFALPAVLYFRTVSRVLAKGRYRRELLKSLPLIAMFVVAWAAGEVVGYWTGPGHSLAKVR